MHVAFFRISQGVMKGIFFKTALGFGAGSFTGDIMGAGQLVLCLLLET